MTNSNSACSVHMHMEIVCFVSVHGLKMANKSDTAEKQTKIKFCADDENLFFLFFLIQSYPELLCSASTETLIKTNVTTGLPLFSDCAHKTSV